MFSGKALVHNLRPDDFGRPLDEVRDLFWNTPRMPLLPGGDSDLQRGVFEAVSAGELHLVGSDGVERVVTNPGEIGVGQSSLRLADTAPTGPGHPAEESAETSDQKEEGGTPVPESEVSFTLMASLGDDAKRDAIYALVQGLADRVDEGAATYTQLMLKLRLASPAAESLADLAREAGADPNVRDT